MSKKSSAKAPIGVAFPADEQGKVSTTPIAHKILGAALEAGPRTEGGGLLPSPVGESSKRWRFGYVQHFKTAIAAMASSTENAVKIARTGLDTAYSTFEFHRDGAVHPLPVAMDGTTYKGTFNTGVVKGTGVPDTGWAVPYEGRLLCDPIETARSLGEPSQDVSGHWSGIQKALEHLATTPGSLDLTDRVFVLIGATSEMGPLEFLLRHNATVVAIARPGGKWKGLLEKSRALAGELHYPISAGSEGADAMAQTPELANWLTALFPDRELVVCCYIYQDGEAFVRASVAMDAIVRALTDRRKVKPAIAFIDTPTHVHTIPDPARPEPTPALPCKVVSQQLYQSAPLWQKLLQGCQLKPMRYERTDNTNSPNHLVFSAVSSAQGPNYALAKLIQRWRAVVAHEADGQLVSINVGPGARTASVMHAPQVAAVLNQIHHFQPNAFYDPDTVCELMALLLVHDVVVPKLQTQHPLDLIANNAWHGGAWSSPHTIDSIGPVAFVIHLLKRHAIWLLPLTAISMVYGYSAATGTKMF